MTRKKKFSVRQGVQPEPTPSIEEAPKALRYALLKYFEKKYMGHPASAGEILEDFLQLPGLRSGFYNQYDPRTWLKFHGYIDSFEWWKVYDFIEFVYAAEDNRYERERFLKMVNEVLSQESSPWRMDYKGEVVYQGTESFESAVHGAVTALDDVGLKTARSEMLKALRDLSTRPHPDLTGAVQHAMAALECAATEICGETGETLGDVVKKHPDRFPPPIDQAVTKLYGFASNRGRHIAEGGEPELKEVELVVGIAAVVATYLTRE